MYTVLSPSSLRHISTVIIWKQVILMLEDEDDKQKRRSKEGTNSCRITDYYPQNMPWWNLEVSNSKLFSYYHYREMSLCIWLDHSLHGFTKYSKQNKAEQRTSHLVHTYLLRCWQVKDKIQVVTHHHGTHQQKAYQVEPSLWRQNCSSPFHARTWFPHGALPCLSVNCGGSWCLWRQQRLCSGGPQGGKVSSHLLNA